MFKFVVNRYHIILQYLILVFIQKTIAFMDLTGKLHHFKLIK